MGMAIEWDRPEGVRVGTFGGSIHTPDADDFRDLVEAGIGPGDDTLILDLGRSNFVSSAGFRALLVLAARFRGPGRQLRVCLSAQVREILAISGLDRFLQVHASRGEALAAAAPDAGARAVPPLHERIERRRRRHTDRRLP